jgi:serine/threonine protein kinase
MRIDKDNLESLFFAAIVFETKEQQQEFVKSECADDDSLYQELVNLLDAHARADLFLESGVEVEAAFVGNYYEADSEAVYIPGGQSILQSLEEMYGTVPHVALRDHHGEKFKPVVRPSSTEIPEQQLSDRIRIDGEIARGGMGAILKARDTDLGRDLAIKVLLDSHSDNSGIVQRFIEEAQIGGQLQHPGIIPLYELGRFADERPYFAMKLVQGETLSALLSERNDLDKDRPKLIGIFEQICQTIAYVHSRGVIHRDLKPANVMVGAFGEVQVMDWGLAKVLGAGGLADERKAQERRKENQSIKTVRSDGEDLGSLGSHTQAGSVMGTPAYMPPEQARGEIDKLDERADVFGLGAILCEILTGSPPYVGDSGREVYTQARKGATEKAISNLSSQHDDQELREIAIQCLSTDQAKRPRNAGEIADLVSNYLSSVQDRLRKTEIAKLEAQARAEEELRRRKLHYLIAIILVLCVICSGVAASYFHRLQQAQSQLLDDKSELAERNKALADDREVERIAAMEAKKDAESARQLAVEEQKKTTSAKVLAENRLNQSNRNLYVAQMAYANQFIEQPDALSRLEKTANHWIPDKDQPDYRGWEWYYLNSHAQKNTIKLRPSPHSYTSIAVGWSPTKHRIITVGKDGYPMHLLDAIDAKLLKKSPQESHSFRSQLAHVAFSPDGEFLAVMRGREADGGGELGIYDASSLEKIQKLDFVDKMGTCKFSATGRELAINSGSKLYVFNMETNSIDVEYDTRQSLGSHFYTGKTTCLVHRDLAWTGSGFRLASIDDESIQVFDFTSAKPSQTVVLEQRPNHVDLSEDGKYFAVHLSESNNIEVWTLEDRPTKRFKIKQTENLGSVAAFSWSPDSSHLAVTSGQQASILTIADGQEISRHTFEERSLYLDWHHDGQHLCSAGLYDQVEIWNPFRTEANIVLGERKGFRWSRDGNLLVAWQGTQLDVFETICWKTVYSAQFESDVVDATVDSNNSQIISALESGKLAVDDMTGQRRILNNSMKCESIDSHPNSNLVICGHENKVIAIDYEADTEVSMVSVGADWAGFAEVCRWDNTGRNIYIHSLSNGVSKRLEIDDTGLFLRGQGNMGMSSTGRFSVTSPITKRGITIHRIDANHQTELIQKVDVAAEWNLDISNDGKRVLIPKTSGLSIIHCDSGTAVTHWEGDTKEANWDAWNMRVASLQDGKLIIRSAIPGYANDHSSNLLPWLKYSVDQPFDSTAFQRLYPSFELVSTAFVQGEHDVAIQLIGKLDMSEFETEQLVQSLANSSNLRPSETHFAEESVAAQALVQFQNFLPESSAVREKIESVLNKKKTLQRATHILHSVKNPALLSDVKLEANDGVVLSLQEDDSIYISGANPERSIYRVSGRSPIDKVTAIRIEAIPDARLPHGSSGRAENGSFNVSEFNIQKINANNQTESIRVGESFSDFERGGEISAAFDENPHTHWSIGGSSTECHVAILKFESPITLNSNERISISIDSGEAYKHHGLGRFRISLTNTDSTITDEQKFLYAKSATVPTQKLAAALYLNDDSSELEELLQEHPKAGQWVGDLHLLEQDWESAIVEFSRTINSGNHSAKLFAKRARCYQATKHWQLSANDWHRAIELERSYLHKAFQSFIEQSQWEIAATFGGKVANSSSDSQMQAIAATLRLAGEIEFYKLYCQKLIKKHSNSKDHKMAERVCKACLLTESKTLSENLPIATLMRHLNSSQASSNAKTWSALIIALHHVRSGLLDEAENHLEIARGNTATQAKQFYEKCVGCLLQFKLGNTEESKRLLGIIETTYLNSQKISNVQDDLIIKALMKELRQLHFE